MAASQLLAGAAEADITPAMGTQIAGNIGVLRPASQVQDRLLTRAIVLESADERVCLVSADVLAIRNDCVDEVRRRAQEKFGLDPARIMVNCTQNHHSPSVGHCFCLDESVWRRWVPAGAGLDWILGGCEEYNELFFDRTVDAIGAALADMQPVTLRVGRAIEGGIAFNRRCIFRDGTADMHPRFGDTNVLQVEGPIDPEVSLLVMEGEGGAAVASILHFSCHPCHGVDQYTIANGWPGAACDGLRELLGGVPMVANGCCGNLHPRNPLGDEESHRANSYRAMGGKLTEDARAILGRLEDVSLAVPLGFRRSMMRIPLRPVPDEMVTEAEALLAEHPEPMWLDEAKTRVSWDWIYAVSRVDLAAHYDAHPWYDYEIQAFRIGDVAMLAVVGEPFVEGQLATKLDSPAAYTIVAHMSNGYVGYVPTRLAFKHGGFETRMSVASKLEEAALENITAESLRLLGELF